MMDENLLCLYTGQVEKHGGAFVIDVPEREVELGTVDPGETYKVALVRRKSSSKPAPSSGAGSDTETPVDAGEVIEVEIDSLGDQGDGIGRVGPGYVVIVPDTSPGERVTVEITETRENVAFAEVVERHDETGYPGD